MESIDTALAPVTWPFLRLLLFLRGCLCGVGDKDDLFQLADDRLRCGSLKSRSPLPMLPEREVATAYEGFEDLEDVGDDLLFLGGLPPDDLRLRL